MAEVSLQPLEVRIGYQFSQPDLAHEALTHPSLQEQKRPSGQDYQRLEFLGDAVLGLVVANILFSMYPDEREGDLAKRKAALVSGEQLVEVAKSWQLGDFLLLSGRAEAEGGRDIATNMEDACEALLGAVYLDGGFAAAEKVICAVWEPLADKVSSPPKDPKTTLQEWAQARGLPLPDYTVIKTDGPAHEPLFTVQVTVEGLPAQEATGSSKKQASSTAAEGLLGKIP